MHPLTDLLIGLRFFSRLPIPSTDREAALGSAGLAMAAPMVPAAGLIIGLIPAVALLLALATGLPTLVAATLAVLAAVIVTGGLHEDAIADCADGFGGGTSCEKKLEIMRDSHVGAFGACAIAFSLILRIASLAAVAAQGSGRCALVILAAAALSRTAALLPLAILPPARAGGTGVSAAQQDPGRVAVATILALITAAALLAPVTAVTRIASAFVVSLIATLATIAIAQRQIGGQTGDVAGATQQGVEIAVYLAFAAAV